MHQGCHHAAGSPSTRVPGNLTRELARERAGRVGEVRYGIDLVLAPKSNCYTGTVTLDFEVLGGEGDLPVDFQGRRVEGMTLNREPLAAKARKGNLIVLPGKALRKGRNTLVVEFENDYDNDGAGLHKSIDPADGNEYFYGQFEPFDANRVFPCFDQPDLKAHYHVTVEAPREWEVVANAPLARQLDVEDRRRHEFAPAGPFSTYIFGLCAGPFAVWNDPKARIPSRIMAAQSRVEDVDFEEIFEVTRQGFDFFEDYFDVPYPYGKYDQIFVPQFNWGAMENVACVCFNDAYLFRHEPTMVERGKRANTVLHEMAHMWFGNLVTMEWWNDLWLNESFATYMAYLAEARVTKFKDAWSGFYRLIKSWAYWQDQLPTTHPIETPVPDTDTTHTNFDGITYGKGASTLKQLVFYIGEPAFRRGVSKYLKKYSQKNARREDFLAELGKAARKDLKKWAQLWLETAGTNVITPVVKVKDGKVERFELRQEKGNGDQKLRPHRLKVACYEKKPRGGLKMAKAVDVLVEKARTRVPALEGRKAPDFVYANHEDHAFAKVRLDPASLDSAAEHLARLPDPFLRSVIWQTIWFMIRDQVASPALLPNLFVRHMPHEDDAGVLRPVWNYLLAATSRYMPDAHRDAARHRVYQVAWEAIREVDPGSDLQKVWFDVLVGSSVEGEALERIENMLEGREFVRGVELDEDKRWKLVTQLCGYGHERAADLLARETKRDRTEKGKEAAFKARVSLPDAKIKREAWDQFVNDCDEPLSMHRAGMRGFWWSNQHKLLRPYAKRFFSVLPRVEKGRGNYFVDAFATLLYPSVMVDPKTLDLGRAALGGKKALPTALARNVLEMNDELERSLALRAMMAQEG